MIFLAQARQSGKVDAQGSLIDYESQKIERTVLSTNVSELYEMFWDIAVFAGFMDGHFWFRGRFAYAY